MLDIVGTDKHLNVFNCRYLQKCRLKSVPTPAEMSANVGCLQLSDLAGSKSADVGSSGADREL